MTKPFDNKALVDSEGSIVSTFLSTPSIQRKSFGSTEQTTLQVLIHDVLRDVDMGLAIARMLRDSNSPSPYMHNPEPDNPRSYEEFRVLSRASLNFQIVEEEIQQGWLGRSSETLNPAHRAGLPLPVSPKHPKSKPPLPQTNRGAAP